MRQTVKKPTAKRPTLKMPKVRMVKNPIPKAMKKTVNRIWMHQWLRKTLTPNSMHQPIPMWSLYLATHPKHFTSTIQIMEKPKEEAVMQKSSRFYPKVPINDKNLTILPDSVEMTSAIWYSIRSGFYIETWRIKKKKIKRKLKKLNFRLTDERWQERREEKIRSF